MTQPTSIAEGLWSMTDIVSPGPGFRMDTRMTIVRLPGEAASELLLLSPVRIDDESAAALADLGEVKHLVSPNLFHHFHLQAARARYPEATVWGAEGLEEKCGVKVDQTLTPGELWPGIDVLAIEGMPKFREFALFHRLTGTLITTDLVFNKPHGHNFITRLGFRMFGTYGKFAVSRLFKSMIQDKAAFSASCRKLFDLPIERVIMAHGEISDNNARETFKSTLERHLS
jgi:hypothetical protein